jgi:2-haloacid dehalogenase
MASLVQLETLREWKWRENTEGVRIVMGITPLKSLMFDVFGTVVDFRTTIIQAGEVLAKTHGLDVDWPAFADRWRREGYQQPIRRIARGEAPWERVDILHRRKLDQLLTEFNISGLSEEEIVDFNLVWHRLMPWPDAVTGLNRLRQKYLIGALSNGDFSLLVNMAKHSGLPWDCILSSEFFDTFKPNPRIYQGAARLLDLKTGEIMMVAAHTHDLEGARSVGMLTAFVHRPLEFGPDGPPEPAPQKAFDLVANDFIDLADQLFVTT